MTVILCARVPWPVTAVRVKIGAGRGSDTEGAGARNTRPTFWRCSHCGARVKVVA